MKNIAKKSIIKGLKNTIDLALILQIIGMIAFAVSLFAFLLKNPAGTSNEDIPFATVSSPTNNIMIAFSHPDLEQNIQTINNKFFLFSYLCNCIGLMTLLLITFQLRFIFKSFSVEDFFSLSNSKYIKNIAFILFIWVIVDYTIRFIPGFFIIPRYYLHSSVGINFFKYGIINGILGFNFKMLIASFVIYILSIVFKYGNNLKEESSLTI